MALAAGTYPVSITATRDDGLTVTRNATVTIVDGAVVDVNFNVGTPTESDSVESVTPTDSINVGGPDETDNVEPISSDFVLIAGPDANIKAGDLVVIRVGNGDGSETLSCSAGTVPIESNNGGLIGFYAPEPPLFGDKTLTYNTAITFTVTSGAETVEFDIPIGPKDGEQYGQIASIDPAGIYADDSVQVGNYGHIKDIDPGIDIDVTDGTYTLSASGTVQYALYDGVWSDYVTETFEAPAEQINVGSPGETDSVDAVGIDNGTNSNVAVGTPSESDSVDSVTPSIDAGVVIGVGSPGETDSVDPVTVDAPGAVDVGTPEESDNVDPVQVVNPIEIGVGSPEETDSVGQVIPITEFLNAKTIIRFDVSVDVVQWDAS